jgi:dihydrofolate reductase
MPSDIPLVLVVAVADNGVIGRAGALPWKLKSELKLFRALTLNHPVLMGRRTYLSIGRPLPGRTNIVVSRDQAFAAPGIVVAPTLAAALACARGDALRRGAAAIMVIGGADIYAQLMEEAGRIVLTRVHASTPGDTVFPPLDPAVWRAVETHAHAAGPGDEASFTVVTYERVGAAPAPS